MTTFTTSSVTTVPTTTFVPFPAAAAGYTYLNCYSDAAIRTLDTQVSSISSAAECVNICSTSGYSLAGLEYYDQCFCGSSILNNATPIDPSNCNFPCLGTPTETCGGAFAIQIYRGTPASALPSIPTFAAGYTYLDTFIDGPTRILSSQPLITGTTVESCVTLCSSLNYAFAGLEYSSQCFCGPSIIGTPVGDQTPTMLCEGDKTQFCGGPNLLQVYSGTPSPISTPSETPFTIANANGQCASDYAPGHGNLRTLDGAQTGSNNMTIETCSAFCTGFSFFGVEYGSECYCGNTISSTAVVANNCTVPCAGNATQVCGGGWALNLFAYL